MEQNTLENQNTTQQARPTFLTVLCILTWVGSGLMGLGWLLLTIASGSLGTMLSKMPGIGAMLGAGAAIFGVLTVLCAGNIYAAVQMWKGKLQGLYIYTVTETAYFIVGAIFSMKAANTVKEAATSGNLDMPEESRKAMEMAASAPSFPWMGLIFTIAFIVMYWLNRKALK